MAKALSSIFTSLLRKNPRFIRRLRATQIRNLTEESNKGEVSKTITARPQLGQSFLTGIFPFNLYRNRYYCRHLRRPFSSSSSYSQDSLNNLPYSQQNLSQPLPPSILHPVNTTNLLRHRSIIVASATVLLSAVIASSALLSSENKEIHSRESIHNPSPLYDAIEDAIHRSNDSVQRLFFHIRQTGMAASVLWQSLRSVLSTANHEVRAGFELRVASFLADIAAANETRRAALVEAGGGAVVDWLLDKVASPAMNGCGTQAESARAVAYLIADPNVSSVVLGRPHAVPNLLRFIFSCQPKQSKKKDSRRSSFDMSDSLKGRSMLVAAIMDIITSNCNSLDKISFNPSLPGNAETKDIAEVIQVIEDGAIHFDYPYKDDDEDGGTGMKGIGMKILEGATVVGLSRDIELMKLERKPDSVRVESVSQTPKVIAMLNKRDSSIAQYNLSSAVVPGLWDDLHCQHVAVPFAAWALANWAMASEANRSLIQELDQDGYAIATALKAPERSVKWHGSLVARLLLEDRKLPLNDSVPDWSVSLISTVSQASKNEDIPLAQVALSAFSLCVERSNESQKIVMEKGLNTMRDVAKRMEKHKQVQEELAHVLELLYTGRMHLSLEEAQKWAGILLFWVSGKYSSAAIRCSAVRTLSCILEDYGPSSLPISQAWLTILLDKILRSNKEPSVKGGSKDKSNELKAQIDQSNVVLATQTTNQLANAVVNLAGSQLRDVLDSDAFPLLDLLSLEPFSLPFKNLKKDSMPKISAADSSLATLKGIKSLSELCVEDSVCQEKIADLGILCLLRRFLLCDDYEKLAAKEAYDASSMPDSQEWVSSTPQEPLASKANDAHSARVPPVAHIRRHAARLLTILSILPNVQKIMAADKTWCKWLEDCANGKIASCSDAKVRSYARATLLNIFCYDMSKITNLENDIPDDGRTKRHRDCPRFQDMVFLVNPELPHWKSFDKLQEHEGGDDSCKGIGDCVDSDGTPTAGTSNVDCSVVPQVDIVFVHGIRGGPYRTWRIGEDKSSTKSGLVEKIDDEAGKQGTFWPGEWLSADFPRARLFSLKYKSNLTQWSGASLPLEEVSSMLLQKLIAAGIGDRPVVFITHSMGGLVVKEMLHKAKAENFDKFVNNTVGIVFYSCPHFGSKLAEWPWRFGFVLRPAPSIGELRSGSPKLTELNDSLRHLHNKGMLEVLSFCETKLTPLHEAIQGYAFSRWEIVSMESAYPGYGELVVLDSTDHVNSCKPISRTDPSYRDTLEFLRKLRSRCS